MNNKIKILLVGPSITRTKGGMATVIKNILSLNANNPLIDLTYITTHVDHNIIQKILLPLRAILQILPIDYDIMHIHVGDDVSIFRKSIFVFLGKLQRKPVIIHVHGGQTDKFYYKSSFFIKYYIRKTFAACTKVLVLSDYWKVFFENLINPSKIKVLPNGVAISTFSKCYVPGNTFNNFLFIGRLSKLKGIYDLVEAVNILVNRQNQKQLLFYLAGEGDTETVLELIKKYGLGSNIKLLGWLNDEEKLYWLSQVQTIILPSYVEALPMVLIEGMAAGKVIISTRVGGIPELVKEDINGFLYNPGDIPALCNYINYVVSHPEKMSEIAVNNLMKTDLNYNLKQLNSQLINIYSSLNQKE